MEDVIDEAKMVLGVQILGIGFGLFMAYLFFLHYKRHDITRLEWMGWTGLWLLFIFITLRPHSLDFLKETFRFSRTLDLFLFVGVIFIVFMTLYLYLHTRHNSSRVDRLVRRLAKEWAHKK